MILGTVAELKTKRIAQRLLDPILVRINSFDYRPSKIITLEKFADVWETQVLTHQKPSSVKAVKAHLRTHIRKHLGKVLLHELTPQIQQNFVTLLSQKVSRKTVCNVLGTLSSMTARRSRGDTAHSDSRRANCGEKVNKEEKLAHRVSSQLLILLGKLPLRQVVVKLLKWRNPSRRSTRSPVSAIVSLWQ